jgi:fatty acid desaturase
MSEPPPNADHLSRLQSEQLERRRRGRSWAIFIVLAALAALFYAITMVKMAHQ